MSVFFVARCDDCDVDIPFHDRVNRNEWARAHATGCGHKVAFLASGPNGLVADALTARRLAAYRAAGTIPGCEMAERIDAAIDAFIAEPVGGT